jgi:hypothetical protein
MMQTTTRRFDFGIAGAVTSRPCLSGCFRVFGDIETYNGTRDTSCGRLAEGNQCYKSWDARLIIAIPRDNNAATSNASALVPFAAGLGMKVRGSHRLGKNGTHPAPPSSHW